MFLLERCPHFRPAHPDCSSLCSCSSSSVSVEVSGSVGSLVMRKGGIISTQRGVCGLGGGGSQGACRRSL